MKQGEQYVDVAAEWMLVEPGGLLRSSQGLREHLGIEDGDMVYVVAKRPEALRNYDKSAVSQQFLRLVADRERERQKRAGIEELKRSLVTPVTEPASAEPAPSAEPSPSRDP